MLQRRLASSTHAILRSLERRRERLDRQAAEMLDPTRIGRTLDPDYRVTGRVVED